MGMFQVYYLHSSVASNIVLTVPHCHGNPAILRVSTVCIGCTRICNHHATRASLPHDVHRKERCQLNALDCG